MFALRASLLLSAASTAVSYFLSAPTDLLETTGFLGLPVRFKEVPTGICELDPNVKSYSGYVDVSENEHIFFWFFEARNTDPSKAPLTAKIAGGPGGSSMGEVFAHDGPCYIDGDGKVVHNPYSWSNMSNMIYIDQPTQTGFSYSVPVNGYLDPYGAIIGLPDATCPDYVPDPETCGTYSYPNYTLTADSTRNAAPNFWKTLQGFMGAFPQYSRNGFHLSTDSYGGRYGSIFSEYITTQNAKNISGARHIPLESLSIGNGWFDSAIQHQSYYNFTVSPGNTYDYFPYNASKQSQLYNNLYGPGNCIDRIKHCAATGIDKICAHAEDFCSRQVATFYMENADRHQTDVRGLPQDPLYNTFYSWYLNLAEVHAALGVYQNFTIISDTVHESFGTTGDGSREDGILSILRRLVEQNVTVMFYAGDADYICNWLGVEAVAEELNTPGFSSAGYVNLTTSDNKVHGQVKQAGKFSFTRIYEAGQFVSFSQPLTMFEVFGRVINGQDVATGRVTVEQGYTTVGTKKSEFREGSPTTYVQALPDEGAGEGGHGAVEQEKETQA
ncbi:hypothetical protein PZA11_002215 [Diplocarpon coronariae]